MRNSLKSVAVLAGLLAIALNWACPKPATAETTGSVASLDAASTVSVTMPDSDRKRILVAKLEDESINPVTAKFLVDTIEMAEREGVPVVIQLDTPGGLLQSTREIVKKILGSRVPVVTYVYPSGSRAASAGVFITLASHVAAMAPSTNIGAAHVVDITGNWPSPGKGADGETTSGVMPLPIRNPLNVSPRDVMSEKVMNDTLAWVEGIAHLRGRNGDWARSAVEKSESVTAEVALDLGVIDLVAGDLSDLLQKMDGMKVNVEGAEVTLKTAGAAYEYVELSTRQRILNTLANPNVALMLLLIGFALLAYELTHPGLIVPGIVGIVSLLLAALALKMLPTNYVAILLILTGIALIIAEIKFTSYGLLTFGGAVCLFFGALALFDQPKPFIGVSVYFVLPLVASITGVFALLVFLILRTHSQRPAIGEESFVGEIAEVARALDPEGKIFFNGSYWNAVSAKPIAAGAKVRIVGMERMCLIVEPLDKS